MFNPVPLAIDVFLARTAVRKGRKWWAFAPLAALTVVVMTAILLRHS